MYATVPGGWILSRGEVKWPPQFTKGQSYNKDSDREWKNWISGQNEILMSMDYRTSDPQIRYKMVKCFYGAEGWTVNINLMRKLEAFE